MGFDDNKDSIIDWLCDFNPDLYDKLQKSIWIDKGYGFFRNWMDLGQIKELLKGLLDICMKRKLMIQEI
jgi:hypothetical protein